MFNCKLRDKRGAKTEKVPVFVDYHSSEYYNAPVTDKFIFAEIKGIDGRAATIQTSDIAMLFNQQRLDKMSSRALLDTIEQMAQNNSSLRAVRNSMTDNQLLTLVKSRFIQSKSELLAYSSDLSRQYGRLSASAAPVEPVEPEPPIE